MNVNLNGIPIALSDAAIVELLREKILADGPLTSTPRQNLPAIGAAWQGGQGGIYAGVTIHDNAPHALVLLPGEAVHVNWKDAQAWADKQGGILPSRFDQLALFKNLKSEFKDSWYWSSAPYAGAASYAWVQHFSNGGQDSSYVDVTSRARAVRRVKI